MRQNRVWTTLFLCLASGGLLYSGCGDDNDSAAQPSLSSGAGGVGGSSAGAGGNENEGGEGGDENEGGEGGSTTVDHPIIDLRADNNRDGKIDFTDDADDKDEDSWDKTHGAIFLANIDDDQKSCKMTPSDIDLPNCNDAADEEINGEEDLLDLARLKTAPWTDAPDNAVGRISVEKADRIHLFKNDGAGNFKIFRPATDTLSAEEIRSGVELAIEAIDIVRDPEVWDGFVDLTYTITLEDESIEGAVPDKVRMRVAPVLLHHHLQPAETTFVANITGDPGSSAMRKDLKKAVTDAKVPGGLQELKNLSVYGDQWTQDYFETGYMTLPTEGGNHIVRVAFRSANVYYPKKPKSPLREAGRMVFSVLRGKDFAAVQEFDIKQPSSMVSLNSFGNTETIPPYSMGDKDYPLGRIFRGSVSNFYTDKNFSKMLEAQQVQPPVYVDTSWLLVGHVDETITFVKTNTPRGWTIVANDPRLAKKMLEEQVAKGNGNVTMFQEKYWVDFDNNKEVPAEVSISDVLADKDVIAESASSAAEVDNQLAILQKETGITDEEIIRIPYLHENAEGYSVAYQVGTVNGIYLSNTDFGAPDPHGPVIDGKDIFKEHMTQAFAKHGIKVHYIEDWDLYHRLSGEVHCGSNVTRQISPTEKWWESGY